MSSDASNIYTKTGDDGTTGRLFGGRLGKDDVLVEACGDLDEAVAALGLARAELAARTSPPMTLIDDIITIQRLMFVVAADLMANPRARDRLVAGISLVEAEDVGRLEQLIDDSVTMHPLRPVFVVPGATTPSAALDLARAVIRRAERHTIAAARAGHHVSDPVMLVLNRASDLLFVLARAVAGDHEVPSHD